MNRDRRCRSGAITIARASALALSIALVLAVLVPGTHAAPGTGRLIATLGLDSSGAPLIAGQHVGTLSQARRVLGRPDRLSPLSGTASACRASWLALGLAVDFARTRAASCSTPTVGSWIHVRATARRWHTQVGLHVGDTASSLHALYPTARRLAFLGPGVWELERGGPYCDGGEPFALGAHVHKSRVAAVVIVRVPACG